MTIYCECESPLIAIEHDAGCRRCGRPVNFTPDAPAIWHAPPYDEHGALTFEGARAIVERPL